MAKAKNKAQSWTHKNSFIRTEQYFRFLWTIKRFGNSKRIKEKGIKTKSPEFENRLYFPPVLLNLQTLRDTFFLLHKYF